jgi:FkbM family methyltransferase
MKYIIKLIFEQITGLTVYKKLPHGQNSFDDLKFHFKNHSFDLFFDIGANIGQSISSIREYFPSSEIWSFEPIQNTYKTLTENLSDNKVKCFQIGFGSEKSELEVYNHKDTRSTRVSFNSNVADHDKSIVQNETVKVETLDSFCNDHGIKEIDYVKIDTEGYDLQVLRGATHLLQNDKLHFIETEVSMNPENTFHVKFEDVKQYLEKFDYRIFGIYEQVPERSINKPILRRVNVVFVSQTIYNNVS